MLPVCLLGTVPHETIATYCAIGRYADTRTHDGAFPSLRTLAKLIDVNASTIARHVETLTEAGALTVTPGDTRRSNLYRIEDPCGTCWKPRGSVASAGRGVASAEQGVASAGHKERHLTRDKEQDLPLPPPRASTEPPGGGNGFFIEEQEQAATAASQEPRSIEGEKPQPQSLDERARSAGVDRAQIRREVLLDKERGGENAPRNIDAVTRSRVEDAIEMAEAVKAEDDYERELEALRNLRDMGADFETLGEWWAAIKACEACDETGQIHLTGLITWPPKTHHLATRDDPAVTWSDRCPHTSEWREAGGRV